MKSSETLIESDYKRPEAGAPPAEWQEWKKRKRERQTEWKEKKMAKKAKREEKLKAEMEEKQKQKHEEQKRSEKEGRKWTLSVAVAGSILENAQSAELRSYLAGQVARACVIFNVDEIVVFDDKGTTTKATEQEVVNGVISTNESSLAQMARILQYLECPQYMRKQLFPQHKDLQYAGLLNPLDSPHHVRADEEVEFREGVVTDKPVAEGKGSWVHVGLQNPVQIDKRLVAGTRVTVQMTRPETDLQKKAKGKAVGPSFPRTSRGLYWGYLVRQCESLGAIFKGCPFKGGYDLTIGTSEKGLLIDEISPEELIKTDTNSTPSANSTPSSTTSSPTKPKHLLVVFGGVRGLEFALENDQELDVEDASLLFNHYLNTCPDQGSRTIRTEEAILVSLAALRPLIHKITR